MYPLKDVFKTTIFVEINGMNNIVKFIPNLPNNEQYSKFLNDKSLNKSTLNKIKNEEEEISLFSEVELKLLNIFVTVSNCFFINIRYNTNNYNNFNKYIKSSSVDNSFFLELTEKIFKQILNSIKSISTKIVNINTNILFVFRDINEDGLKAEDKEDKSNRENDEKNNEDIVKNTKCLSKYDIEAKLKSCLNDLELQTYFNSSGKFNIKLFTLKSPFNLINDNDKSNSKEIKNYMTTHINKNRLNSEFILKVNEIREFFDESIKSIKYLNGKKLNGHNTIKLIDYLLDVGNFNYDSLWITLLKTDLDNYHDTALINFLEELNLNELLHNQDINVSLVSNAILVTENMSKNNKDKEKSKSVNNTQIDQKNKNEEITHKEDEHNKFFHNLIHKNKDKDKDKDNKNHIKKKNNLINSFYNNSIDLDDLRLFAVLNKNIKEKKNIFATLFQRNNEVDESCYTNVISNINDQTLIYKSSIFEDYILIHRINKANNSALVLHEHLIKNCLFFQYTDYEDIFIYAKRDLRQEIKRIKSKLLLQNSIKINNFNHDQLVKIFDALSSVITNKKENIVKIKHQKDLNGKIDMNEDVDEVLDPIKSFKLLLNDYDSVSIGKSSFLNFSKFLFKNKKINDILSDINLR